MRNLDVAFQFNPPSALVISAHAYKLEHCHEMWAQLPTWNYQAGKKLQSDSSDNDDDGVVFAL